MKNQNNTPTLKYIKEGDVCAEIGVWKGHRSSQILKCKPSKLHLIDPWESQDVIGRCYSVEQEKMDKIHEGVSTKLGKLSNVEIHRNFSTDVIFPKEYFDWIYIDGDHSCDAVKKDLAFYYPLMKRGGYLCGDDYGLWSNRPKEGFGSDGGGGPKPAVDEFVKSHKLEIKIAGNQYVIFVEKG
jgi:hypothetical protein